MKNLFSLFCFLLLCSCATDADELEIDNTQRAAPPMSITVNCVDPNPNSPMTFTGYLTWSHYLPYSTNSSAYIEFEPLNDGSVHPIVVIAIPTANIWNGSFNIIHNGPFILGAVDVWMDSIGSVNIRAKHFNYRYVIYDPDSGNTTTSPWKYFNLVN